MHKRWEVEFRMPKIIKFANWDKMVFINTKIWMCPRWVLRRGKNREANIWMGHLGSDPPKIKILAHYLVQLPLIWTISRQLQPWPNNSIPVFRSNSLRQTTRILFIRRPLRLPNSKITMKDLRQWSRMERDIWRGDRNSKGTSWKF